MLESACRKLLKPFAASRRGKPVDTGERTCGGQPIARMAVRFAGRSLDLFVRAGTTDVDLVGLILSEQSEYQLPAVVQPRVIFDIGANIGVTAAYFALCYPQARLYCFEPLPDNVDLLRRNVAAFGDRVTIVAKGLADAPGSFTYHMSNDPRNFGGGSFTSVGVNLATAVELPVISVSQALAELGVDQVDVFKVDTEGSEWPIIRGIPDAMLAGAQALIGELHSVGDWQVCDRLAASHDLELHKRLAARCFPFLAVRRDLVRAKAQPAAA